MKILLMTTVMEFGGAQKALLELARGLQERGHQIVVLVTHDLIDVSSHFATAYGVKIVNLEMKRPGTTGLFAGWMLLRGLWRMYCHMKLGNYDVLQTFMIYANLMGQCVGGLAGIPVRVSSQRNRNDNYRWLTRFLDRHIANSKITDKMVAVCDANLRYCIESEGIRSIKVVTIHNGISMREQPCSARTEALRRELDVNGSHIVATVVARLHPQKGHRYLLDAVASLQTAVPQLRVLLVGDGPLRSELSRTIERRNLSLHVRMLGNRRDVGDILAISDLFVLPSLWEGLPNAILEAMASRLAVVATSVDGNVEAVVHGITGLLVPTENADALAEAISELARDPKKRSSMGEAGRKRVEQQFSAEQFIRSFEDLYVQLAGFHRKILARHDGTDCS